MLSKNPNKRPSYVALAKLLTEWRNGIETPWLKEAPCHPLQHALKDLERAYKNFFAKRADFPRFKRKGSGQSFRYPDAKQFVTDQANSLKRRQAIEPIIGHLKADHRMNRCHLKGADGDSLHAVLCAAGYNIRWLLRMIVKKGLGFFYGCCRPRV